MGTKFVIVVKCIAVYKNMPPYRHKTWPGSETESNQTLVKEFIDGFSWEKRDKRLDGLPLMSSIWPSIYICLAYLYLVRVAGPIFMRNREVLKLNQFARCYNCGQFVCELLLIPWLSLHYFLEGNGWGK